MDIGEKDHLIVIGEEDGILKGAIVQEDGEIAGVASISDPEQGGEGDLYDVEECPSGGPGVFHVHRSSKRKGPAKVNSSDFCEGWERIFGSRGRTLN